MKLQEFKNNHMNLFQLLKYFIFISLLLKERVQVTNILIKNVSCTRDCKIDKRVKNMESDNPNATIQNKNNIKCKKPINKKFLDQHLYKTKVKF